MKRTLKVSFAVCLLFSALSAGYGQYWGERVQQKSFEQEDFFFTPYHLIPFGIGSFKATTPGLLNEPLLNLAVNPANLYSDSLGRNYVYVDFRSSREIYDRYGGVYPYDMIALRTTVVNDIYRPYPFYYFSTRKELEPVFSGAYLMRPTSDALKSLFVGVSYQAVMQDEKYYSIPQDIYKSAIGYDYLGVRNTASSESIPIVDKYKGTDDMHKTGHFVSLFGGYDVNEDLQVGVELSRVWFSRDGAFGSQNLWENYYQPNYSSLWRNEEARNQSYRHWDLSAGVNYRFNEEYTAGLTGGYLWGPATQALTRGDSSFWGHGRIGVGTGWSYYMNSGATGQTWQQDGKSWYGGVNFTAKIHPDQTANFYYLYTRQDVDLALASNIIDTSYGNSRYRYIYNNDTSVSSWLSESFLSDVRRGGGTTIGNFHRAAGSLQWQISPKLKLNIGAQLSVQSSKTETNEAVIARRQSRYVSTSPNYNYSSLNAEREEKTLLWDFQTRQTTFWVPIVFTVRTSETVELLFGLNRKMSRWEIKDVTLAVFKFREKNTNGTIERRENFGERYTMPKESISDVQTSAMLGITFLPSKLFNLRFLVVPNFVDTYGGQELSDFQWWIGVNLLP